MPSTCVDTADAIELAETLQLIARWTAADLATVDPSFLAYIRHPTYNLGPCPPTWTALDAPHETHRPPSRSRAACDLLSVTGWQYHDMRLDALRADAVTRAAR